MKRLLETGLVLFFLLFFAACQKEEFATDLDKIEYQLKTFVADHYVTTCSVWVDIGDNIQRHVDHAEFEITDGFLEIKTEPYARYNLLNLSYYYSLDGNLELYFLN